MTDFVSHFHNTLRLLARPIDRRRTMKPMVVRAYRGFGSSGEICLFGRILDQPDTPFLSQRSDIPGDLMEMWRRMWQRGVRGATVEARFAASRRRTRTDRYGFFFVRLPLETPVYSDRLWHRADLIVTAPDGAAIRGAADVLIAPRSAEYGVISDIDDTVVHTGVAQKLKMLWHLFFTEARSRVAFPGVGAFYRALHRGASGSQGNPMLYVSRGPWSIYEVLDTFFNLHDIPVGPVLYLRYWGMTIDHPLPRRARDHKLSFIRQTLDLYADLPFILIGDSGQRDPEIYARIVREHPGRIRAIYIRDVDPAADRRRDIAGLAKETARTGTAFLLAADSHAMAQHAAREGIIAKDALAEVRAECDLQRSTDNQREVDHAPR